MAKQRHVVSRKDGWKVSGARGDRASSVHMSQRDAIKTARDIAQRQGSEVSIETSVALDAAAQRLPELLEGMGLGETLTLLDQSGAPIALVVSLRHEGEESPDVGDWDAEWDALAEKVGKAWKTDKSAVEIVSEMRE